MGIISDKWKARIAPEQLVRWIDGKSLAGAVAAPLYAFDPFHTKFRPVEQALYYEARRKRRPRRAPKTLSVMTWNIKFGGGRLDFWFDSHGDRVVMRDWEVIANLEGVAAKIRHFDPDVLLLQEVDIDSKRVAYIDQMQWLLDHTRLNFGAYASQWRSDFVPSKGLGRVDMGIAVMSKYPIHDAQRIALPQMQSQDLVTRYFYLKRALLTARIATSKSEEIHVVNIHTEAFSTDGTKRRQLDWFKSELDRIDDAGGIFVAGGDLNALPPGSQRLHDFSDVTGENPDFMASDYRSEKDWLTPFYARYKPAIDLAEYEKDNIPHFSHSTTGKVFWSRKLDYLFTNGEFVDGSAMTHQDLARGGFKTMPLSDHAPVSVTLSMTDKGT